VAQSPASSGFEGGGAVRKGAQVIPSAGAIAKSVLAQRQMIYTVNMTVRVENFDSALKSAKQIAKQVGGFLQSSDISKRPDTPNRATLTLRVPAAKLDAAIAAAAKLGQVLEEKRDSQDVTAQVADVTARLQNLRAAERNLRKLMDRSSRMTAMLQVESRLTQVRGQIESLEAQYRSLREQVGLSTLTLQLLEPTAIFKPADHPWSAAFYVGQAWQTLVVIARGLMAVGIYVGVMAPLWLPILLGMWFLLRRHRRGELTA